MTENRSVSDRVVMASRMANRAYYSADTTASYHHGAPHIKHRDLRERYARYVVEVVDNLRGTAGRVLDVGAGEGAVTLPLLEFGCKVTAIDLSSAQLDRLRLTCAGYEELRTICADAESGIEQLQRERESFDAVVMLSVVHHFPDYLSVIRSSAALVQEKGVFFTFQDPLLYASLPLWTRVFSGVAYYFWRLRQGNIAGGFGRWLRRKRGVYLETSVEDNAEYHVVRRGVDHNAIANELHSLGFECRIIPYFSTQAAFWQFLGSKLQLVNTFAVMAVRR